MFSSGLWSRAVSLSDSCKEQIKNAGPTPLEADLRRVTDSEHLSSPQDALENIVAATSDAENRRVIMNHLRQCLSEQEGKQWRRVYAGLAIVEKLLQSDFVGVKTLVVETGEGRHFDLNFRLTFLENFEYSLDLRVQGLVRQRASSIRPKFVRMMEAEAASRLETTVEVEPSASSSVKTEGSETCGETEVLSRAAENGADDSGDGKAFFEKCREQIKSMAPVPPTPLELDLRRVTDSELMSSPDDALRSIVLATNSEDNRKVIMTHLRQALGEENPRQWRRIYGGLAIVEVLLQSESEGAKELVVETSEGRHFDLNFRLSFLKQFEFDLDLRVQNLVRQRASSLIPKFLETMENAVSTAAEKATVSEHVPSTTAPTVDSLDLLGFDGPGASSGVSATVGMPVAGMDLLGFDGTETAAPHTSTNLHESTPAVVTEDSLLLLADFEPAFVPPPDSKLKAVESSDGEDAVSTAATSTSTPRPAPRSDIVDLLDLC